MSIEAPPEPNRNPGLGVTHRTWEAARNALRTHIASFIPAHVVTLTPEMCVRAADDAAFSDIIRSAAVVVADGVGVVWGEGRLSGNRPEKIPGIDLAAWALEEVDRIAGRVYLLGAKPEVIEKTAGYVAHRYPRLSVSGMQDGYFKPEDESRIVAEIASANPHLVLVGMGSPKQETFIWKHLNDLHCGVAMGVGGSFDVWSGTVTRAPGFFRNTGTEWLYRTLTQPGDRLKRIPTLWRFMMMVLAARRKPVRTDP